MYCRTADCLTLLLRDPEHRSHAGPHLSAHLRGGYHTQSIMPCRTADCLTLLLRNMEYCSYATSGGKQFNDFDSAERKFNAVSMEERAKFKVGMHACIAS